MVIISIITISIIKTAEVNLNSRLWRISWNKKYNNYLYDLCELCRFI